MPSRCGAAVNAGQQNCDPGLYAPTGDAAMHCYAYGGPSDPCALNNNNDANDGLDKDPSACVTGDTFFLWDEPDTQGRSYAWAGGAWASYSTRWATQLAQLRARGARVTSPLLKADAPAEHLASFWAACGAACSDTGSATYIDIVAVNPYCGAWNKPTGTTEGCRGGARYVVAQLNTPQLLGGRPLYVSNWAYLGGSTAAAQLPALEAIDAFFEEGSPVHRVYWFGATDYGGGTATNFLTDVVESGERRGETLGALWTARCCEIGSCAAEIEIDDEIEISGNFPPALPGDVPQLPPPPPSWPPGSPEAGGRSVGVGVGVGLTLVAVGLALGAVAVRRRRRRAATGGRALPHERGGELTTSL